tara:strand:- start:5055 stop:5327 length:273 start_codon:yes stop_codon:yes gene_type:complete
MARKKIVKKDINHYKDKAPYVPHNTCPYIDNCVQIIEDEIIPLISETGKTNYGKEVLEVLKANIEFIRSSNETLRRSSKYWYDAANELGT